MPIRHPYPTLPPLDPAQRYTVGEACAYLRVSRSRLYARLARNEIATVRDGRRVYIPGAEIARLSAPAPAGGAP